ncbi:MAG: hypothetical protein IKX48_10040, partial [Victivallales bacterium]|nr:hypothetical protein [Victivallales bacterium]
MIVPYPNILPKDRQWVISLGVFDGVHLGHQAIFKELATVAKRFDAQSAALYFTPNPKLVFHPQSGPMAICAPQQNIDLIHK